MLNDKFVLLGVAGLAAVATAGWMRTPQLVSAGATLTSFQPPPQEFVYESPGTASPSVLYATSPIRSFSTTAAQPVRRSEPLPVRSAAVRRAPVAYDDRSPTVPTVTKIRSKKASAAIIGGSAAAGAAIGGLAEAARAQSSAQ